MNNSNINDAPSNSLLARILLLFYVNFIHKPVLLIILLYSWEKKFLLLTCAFVQHCFTSHILTKSRWNWWSSLSLTLTADLRIICELHCPWGILHDFICQPVHHHCKQNGAHGCCRCIHSHETMNPWIHETMWRSHHTPHCCLPADLVHVLHRTSQPSITLYI